MALRVLFWCGVVIVSWLGYRYLISIILGESQDGPLKSGQRSCNVIALFILWGSVAIALTTKWWWMLIIGVVLESGFRRLVIWSGEIEKRNAEE